MKKETIKVWRLAEFEHLEMRRGWTVAAPYPKHWHDEFQLCLVESGGGSLLWRGCSMPTPAGSLFVVAPGETHANRADDERGCSFRSLYLTADWLDESLSPSSGRSSQRFDVSARVLTDRDLIVRYRQLHRNLECETSRLERETQMLEFLMLLTTRCATDRSSLKPAGSAKRVAEKLRDFIATHYAENLSLAQLAQLAQLSPFHVNRVFSAQYGLPPHAFQTQVRVARARKMLRDGLPISQVAAQTGFADQSHFTRHFKRLALLTPGQYQRDSKNVQDKC